MVATVAALAWGGLAVGEDFKVVNKVFVGNAKKPQAQSTTIFSGGVVYDYLEEPAETMVFDPAGKRFILLDSVRKVRTELSTDEVLDLVERLRRRFSASADPYQVFQAEPKLDDEFDDDSGELTFSSTWMTYRLVGAEAPSREISSQYREFSDWQARLNSLINPGGRLPFPRMILNAALERRGELPREVHLSLKPKRQVLSGRVKLRSEHLLIRRLVESDRSRVTQTGQFMAMFSQLSFTDYQKRIRDR